MSDVGPGPYEPTFAPLVVPTLSAGPYKLRPFVDADIAAIEEASSDRQITEITTVPEVFSHNEGMAFLSRQHERARFADGYSFCLAEGLTDRAVGSVGLWLRDAEFGRADHWLLGRAGVPWERRGWPWTQSRLHVRLRYPWHPPITAPHRTLERCFHKDSRRPGLSTRRAAPPALSGFRDSSGTSTPMPVCWPINPLSLVPLR